MKTSKYKKNKNFSFDDGYEYVYDEETKRYVLREGGIDWGGVGRAIVGAAKSVGKAVVSAVDKVKEAAEKLAKMIEDGIKSISPEKVKNDMKRGFEDTIINPVKREFDKIKNDTENGLKAANDLMVRDIMKIINDIKGALETLKNDADKLMKEILGALTNGFKQMTKSLEDFAKKFLKIGVGLGKMLKGALVDGPVGIGKGLKQGFDDVGMLFSWTGQFLLSYLTCGIHYIENIHRCIFYYAIDAVAKLFYSPVTIFLWLVWEFGETDLYKTHDKIWDTIYAIDGSFYGIFGFHFARYPKNVKNMCYNCKRLKIVALKNKSNQVNYSFNTNLPNMLNDAKKTMDEGASDFIGGFL
jgi:hypothetical protein